MMDEPRVVLDTNVLVAGLRSRRGASFQILSRTGTGEFEIAVSVPLVLEYEDVLSRLVDQGVVSHSDVGVVIDYLCSVAHKQNVFFLWRPFLRDPGDDMVLELAVASASQLIITHNTRDFRGCDELGVSAMTPGEFLQRPGRAT